MGMSRSGRNRLTGRPAECLSADHRLEKRSVSCRCTGSPQIFLQRRATCVRCRTSVEAAIDWLKPPASCAVGSRCSEGASVLRQQSVELGLGLGLARAAGRDPVAALLTFVSTLQLLAEFLGAVAFQRQLDQASQRRPARRPRPV